MFVTERYHLAEEVKQNLKQLPVQWGFGEFSRAVYFRTYSRQREDGSQEQWADTVIRVVEGVISVRQDWYKKMGVPWDEKKWSSIAQRMAEAMFHMRFLPPGRGCWAMGTEYIFERGSAALNNCFAGSEKFITYNGVKTLAEMADKTTSVLTHAGWSEAKIRSFGVQPLQEVVFAPAVRTARRVQRMRTNHKVSVKVTPNHRWPLADGSLTTNLKVGDIVEGQRYNSFPHSLAQSNGVRHGLVFADGTISYRCANGEETYQLRLCGDKKRFLVYFGGDEFTITYPETFSGDPLIRFRGKGLKDVPDPTYSSEYINGFIRGWMFGDGAVKPSGSIKLSTQDHNAVDWMLEHAAQGGYYVTGISTETKATNFGERRNPLISLSVRDSSDILWSVESITPTNAEEVYCAVVPGVERFTLASGIYTSNCAYVEITDNLPAAASWSMDMLMCGVGVGFGTREAGALNPARMAQDTYHIPDTREGWAESLRRLLENPLTEFDYSQIRPAGALIRGFGGVASGPDPLKLLHQRIKSYQQQFVSSQNTTRFITDVFNAVGACVVAGNVRRSAELATGSILDSTFLNLKNYELNPERQEVGWMSNNSVVLSEPHDFTHLPDIADLIRTNGEPGVINLMNVQKYGRFKEKKVDAAVGFNP